MKSWKSVHVTGTRKYVTETTSMQATGKCKTRKMPVTSLTRHAVLQSRIPTNLQEVTIPMASAPRTVLTLIALYLAHLATTRAFNVGEYSVDAFAGLSGGGSVAISQASVGNTETDRTGTFPRGPLASLVVANYRPTEVQRYNQRNGFGSVATSQGAGSPISTIDPAWRPETLLQARSSGFAGYDYQRYAYSPPALLYGRKVYFCVGEWFQEMRGTGMGAWVWRRAMTPRVEMAHTSTRSYPNTRSPFQRTGILFQEPGQGVQGFARCHVGFVNTTTQERRVWTLDQSYAYWGIHVGR